MRAASSENGAEDALEELKLGGFTRENAFVRWREERIPDLLPRVGDRPAGAERGVDLAELMFSFETGDLGLSKDRARGAAALGGLRIETSLALADFVRINDGLTKESLGAKTLSEPFDLLE